MPFMKLIVAITGASGINLAQKFINNLPKDIQIHLVVSKHAKKAYKLENNKKIKFKHKNIIKYKDKDIGASIASGSFQADKMVVLPCSMNTLAKFANGISDTLITRAFSVMLKEKKEILIAPREMPLSGITLRHLKRLSAYHVIIAPAILGYYSSIQSLEDMENFIIGKWYDLLGIKNNLYKRWQR
jgi:4-hydroxy-3-polyprenylbenzoate decarboxylase